MQEILSTLPPPAILVFAAVFAAVMGMKYAGKFLGTITQPETSSPTAQVAAMIVDSTVLKACTENLVEAIDGMSKEISETRRELMELRIEMRRGTEESIRNFNSRHTR